MSGARKVVKKKAVRQLEGVMRAHIPAGKAAPAPPLGPALGKRGINIMLFNKEFNQKTQHIKVGVKIPTAIQHWKNRFEITLNLPTDSYYIMAAAGINKGASLCVGNLLSKGKPPVGSITLRQIYEIAAIKQQSPKMKYYSMQRICKMIMDTTKKMGVEVVNDKDGDGPTAAQLEERRLEAEKEAAGGS